ncbi:hypothetical protein BGW80DRAFT_1354091 [Lactifluus volemus]|nr:hypothetical protein BGW80DRAFT_1354091 [Lactifluus volemus]
MSFRLRPLVVISFAVIHATSGFFLSILALGLQRLFPSLKQLPPTPGYFSNLAHHFSNQRDDRHFITSDLADENEGSSAKNSSDDHVAWLLSSQARARAARPSSVAPPSSLWPLKEYPSPQPLQPSEQYRSFPFVPPDSSRDVGLSSDKLAPSHLREAVIGTSVSNESQYRPPVSKHVRKIAEIVPGCNVKDRNRRGKKSQTSTSRVGRGRTDPYQAPYFFPSPVSPWAYDYVRLIQLNRKLDLSSDVPTSYSPLTSSGDDQSRVSSPSSKHARIVRASSHRRSASH